jgi:hypothetical protein
MVWLVATDRDFFRTDYCKVNAEISILRIYAAALWILLWFSGIA